MRGQHTVGQYNSSRTRVWPVFQLLISADLTGQEWLPQLLLLATENMALATHLAKHPGTLNPELLQMRSYSGIELEACFEKSLPPPQRFLRWLIEHHDQMTWPNHGKASFGEETQRKREQLMGKRGAEESKAVCKEALNVLESSGADKSNGKWWAFEGFTEVDCYLETDRLVLLVEGKRTDVLSSAISWYPNRNQLIRNLEVAQAQSKGKEFVVIVLAEEMVDPPSKLVIEQSLPHFTLAERDELMAHYLGCVLWKELCEATGISYDALPKTVG